MRNLKQIYKARYAPIADLITHSPLPSATLQQVDPFLFLNHHGPQVYAPGNNGLPFEPHPHRGMETVTFILDGDISHKDSGGHESVIDAGGVQWMTAGRGLIHAEVSSEAFKRGGGKLEILQLWLNLPAGLKMTEPFYKGLQKSEIPTVNADEGKVRIDLISGNWGDTPAAFSSATGVHLRLIRFDAGGKLELEVPTSHNIFFYVIGGAIDVNGTEIKALHLATFEDNDALLSLRADNESILLLGHAQPLNEPVVAQGPFVMNTEEEIAVAYEDYRQGKFGNWTE